LGELRYHTHSRLACSPGYVKKAPGEQPLPYLFTAPGKQAKPL